jgi:hypothetical protein
MRSGLKWHRIVPGGKCDLMRGGIELKEKITLMRFIWMEYGTCLPFKTLFSLPYVDSSSPTMLDNDIYLLSPTWKLTLVWKPVQVVYWILDLLGILYGSTNARQGRNIDGQIKIGPDAHCIADSCNSARTIDWRCIRPDEEEPSRLITQPPSGFIWGTAPFLVTSLTTFQLNKDAAPTPLRKMSECRARRLNIGVMS